MAYQNDSVPPVPEGYKLWYPEVGQIIPECAYRRCTMGDYQERDPFDGWRHFYGGVREWTQIDGCDAFIIPVSYNLFAPTSVIPKGYKLAELHDGEIVPKGTLREIDRNPKPDDPFFGWRPYLFCGYEWASSSNCRDRFIVPINSYAQIPEGYIPWTGAVGVDYPEGTLFWDDFTGDQEGKWDIAYNGSRKAGDRDTRYCYPKPVEYGEIPDGYQIWDGPVGASYPEGTLYWDVDAKEWRKARHTYRDASDRHTVYIQKEKPVYPPIPEGFELFVPEIGATYPTGTMIWYIGSTQESWWRSGVDGEQVVNPANDKALYLKTKPPSIPIPPGYEPWNSKVGDSYPEGTLSWKADTLEWSLALNGMRRECDFNALYCSPVFVKVPPDIPAGFTLYVPVIGNTYNQSTYYCKHDAHTWSPGYLDGSKVEIPENNNFWYISPSLTGYPSLPYGYKIFIPVIGDRYPRGTIHCFSTSTSAPYWRFSHCDGMQITDPDIEHVIWACLINV